MFSELFIAGLTALQDYVATHVLTCLVPAFLLAGAMVTFVRREAVLALLGGTGWQAQVLFAGQCRQFPGRRLFLHGYTGRQRAVLRGCRYRRRVSSCSGWRRRPMCLR